MEARKILFVLSNSSSQKTITSTAETLGELKRDMDNAGIDYTNMTFYEGRTRTELKDNSSVLPTNVPVAAKGTTPASTTNELVFMLTTANKKISSGAMSDERHKVLEEIKAKGLSKKVMEKFGRNATQCKTPTLVEFLKENSKTTQAVKTNKETKVETKVEDVKYSDLDVTPTLVAEKPIVDVKARKVLKDLLERLQDEDTYHDYDDLLEELIDDESVAGEDDQDTTGDKLSSDELKAMFGNWTK